MQRLGDDAQGAQFAFTFDGQEVVALEGDSVAAAVLAAGHVVLRRTPVNGVPRGPFCMMGACYDCLVSVDGVPNLQACMVVARAGLVVMPMDGARSTEGAPALGASAAREPGDSA